MSVEPFVADSETLARPKRLLASDAFKKLPEVGPNHCCDGATYFIGTDFDGNYLSRNHCVLTIELLRNYNS